MDETNSSLAIDVLHRVRAREHHRQLHHHLDAEAARPRRGSVHAAAADPPDVDRFVPLPPAVQVAIAG